MEGGAKIDDIPEGILRIVTGNALDEIKRNRSPRTRDGTTSSKIKTIVEDVAKKEWAYARSKPQKEIPHTTAGYIRKMLDQFNNTMAVMEPALGADVVEEILKKTYDGTVEQALAELGDLVTSESFIEEIRFAEALDTRTERAYDRLMKMQDRRAKKAAVNDVTLQPGWATRKR